MGYPYTTLEKVTAAEFNQELRRVIETTHNAGETINGATLPVPVYRDPDDDEWYACDGNDNTRANFKGFAISNGTDANPITIQFHGVVSGFTGLSTGEKYYVQDTVGTIGTTVGTNTIPVGVALSATEILIVHEPIYVFGSIASESQSLGASQNNNYDRTIDLNAKPKLLIWRGQVSAAAWSETWYDLGEMAVDAKLNSIFGYTKGNNQNNTGAFKNVHTTSISASKTDSGIGITVTASMNSISATGAVFRINMTTPSGGGGTGTFGSGGYVAVL